MVSLERSSRIFEDLHKDLKDLNILKFLQCQRPAKISQDLEGYCRTDLEESCYFDPIGSCVGSTKNPVRFYMVLQNSLGILYSYSLQAGADAFCLLVFVSRAVGETTAKKVSALTRCHGIL